MSMVGDVFIDDTGIHWTVTKAGMYVLVLRDNRGIKPNIVIGFTQFMADLQAGYWTKAKTREVA